MKSNRSKILLASRLAIHSLQTTCEPLESRQLLSAGGLDPTFGVGGKVVTNFSGVTDDPIRQAALQTGGKIVVLEGFLAGNSQLARYTAAGVLDTTFGTGGVVALGFANGALAVRRDGKIVVAGSPAGKDPNDVLLARYTMDGKVDATFGGGDGQVIQSLFGGNQTSEKIINKVLIRPDNRILVAGSVETIDGTGSDDFALSSFTEAGEIDPFFGVQFSGVTLTDFGNNDTLADVAFTPGGKIVAVGNLLVSDSHHPFLRQDFAVAQYDAFGEPDLSFGGGDGMLTTSFGSFPESNQLAEPPFDSFDAATSLAIDGAGNITVAGYSVDPTDSDPAFLAVARYTPTGTLDSTFSPGGAEGSGKLWTAFGSAYQYYKVALAGGGKFLVAGVVNGDFGLDRFNADGSFDNTFGSGGKVTTDIGAIDNVGDMIVGPDGKVILAGGSTAAIGAPGTSPKQAVLVRYLADAPSGQSPFSGKPIDVSLGELVEFENFDNGGEGVAFHDTDAANLGGAYRNTAVDIQAIPGGGDTLAFAKAGEWTEYTIVAGDHAYCDVTLRYASLKGGGKFHLEIDGRNVSGTITLASTGGWQTYKSIDLSHVEMTPGQHVLRLALDGNDSIGYVGNFDWLHIDQQLENMQVPFNPNHTPWSPNQIIQAEDFNTGGEGFGYHDTELANLVGAYRPGEGVDIEAAGDTGGGFDVGYTKAGEFLSYTINMPQAGLFGLDIRLASLRAGGVFHVEIDGKAVASFNVPATGSWQSYATLSSPKNISLGAGQHVLKLVMDKNSSIGYVANFNWLRLNS